MLFVLPELKPSIGLLLIMLESAPIHVNVV